MKKTLSRALALAGLLVLRLRLGLLPVRGSRTTPTATRPSG